MAHANLPDDDPVEDAPWGPAVLPSATITESIQRCCTRDLKRRRRRTAIERSLCSLGLSMLVVALFYAAIFLMRGFADVGASVFVALGVLHVAALFFAQASRSELGRSAAAKLILASLVPLSFVSVLAVMADSWIPATEFVTDATNRTHVARCASESLVVGVFAFAGIVVSWYRTDPFTPGLSGWIAGLTGGTIGSTAVASFCSDGAAFHLGVGHGLVVLVLGLVGLAAGRRLLSP